MMDGKKILELNQRAWDKIAKNYEENRPKWLVEKNLLFKYFFLNLPKEGKILDIGSGTGLPYAKFLTDNGFKVLGIDLSQEMVKIAKHNVPKAKFKHLAILDLDYIDVFDGAISSFSMLMLNPVQFKQAAERIIRALKKKSLFYLSLNEPWEENVDVDKYTIIEIMGETFYSRAYTESEVKQSFCPLGMNLIKIHRKIERSHLFGEEHTISFIFQKK